MIDVTGLSKTYDGGRVALAGVDLVVRPGEFVALLGPSGAGKSTLLRAVNGLVAPTRGDVTVDGIRVEAAETTLRAVRQRTAMVFQQFNLVGRLTVLENVLAGRLGHRPTLPTLFRRFPRADYRLAETCLGRVGLADRARQRADTLSGGERQRVGVARALAQEPRVLLCDEPVASLDPRTALAVLGLIRRVTREDSLATLVSLHQVGLARAFADRVVGLAQGVVAFAGPGSALDRVALRTIYGGDVAVDDGATAHDGTGYDLALVAHA